MKQITQSQNFNVMRKIANSFKLLMFIPVIIFFSCQKETDKIQSSQEELTIVAKSKDNGHLKQTKTYAATVAQKWQDLQNRFLRTPTTTNPFGRHGHRWFAYSGIALYESVVGGMPGYQSLDDQLTDMPDMPTTEPGKAYHWPTVASVSFSLF